MYYMVGLGKTGHSFLKQYPDTYVWDDNVHSDTCSYTLTAPCDVPWEKIDALILSPGIPHTYPYPHAAAKIARDKNIPILCDIEVFLEKYPTLFYIGITGTNGKSTTTALINHMLHTAHLNPLIGGNIGIPIFDLMPKTLNDYCVLELSSYQLERLPTWGNVGKIAVLTNITSDHLARHGTLDGYIAAKEMILKAPMALIGIDTPPTLTLYTALKDTHPCLIPVSTKQHLVKGISVIDSHLFENGVFKLDLKPMTRLPGLHNAQNMALAYGIGIGIGLSIKVIQKAFMSFTGLAHRLEWVTQYKNIQFVNDSKATNAESVAYALAAYDSIFWIVGGQPKETGLQGLACYYSKIKKAYTIGDSTQTFAEVLKPHMPTQPCGTLDVAMALAFKDALALGYGTILLAPAAASWDQYSGFDARGDHFKTLIQSLKDNDS